MSVAPCSSRHWLSRRIRFLAADSRQRCRSSSLIDKTHIMLTSHLTAPGKAVPTHLPGHPSYPPPGRGPPYRSPAVGAPVPTEPPLWFTIFWCALVGVFYFLIVVAVVRGLARWVEGSEAPRTSDRTDAAWRPTETTPLFASAEPPPPYDDGRGLHHLPPPVHGHHPPTEHAPVHHAPVDTAPPPDPAPVPDPGHSHH